MREQNKMYDRIIYSCFNELKSNFEPEQSFHIILGLSAIHWINATEDYSVEELKFDRIMEGYNFIEKLTNGVSRLESEYREFTGILTGILNHLFMHQNQVTFQKIREIFYKLDFIDASEANEISEFINQLVEFADEDCGVYSTPKSVKKIIVGLSDFETVNSFADYCAGTSGIAVEVFQSIEVNKEINYYGEEINMMSCLISKLLMIVNNIKTYTIINKDALEKQRRDEEVEKFDLVISDIPIGINWNKEQSYDDIRFKYGVPAKSTADWAFYQNAIYKLSENGKAIVVGNKGTLVRSGETDIRKSIIENDLIEAIITLPNNLYKETTTSTELIIFNKAKSDYRKNKILFIDASEYYYRINRNQNTVTEDGILKIIQAYTSGNELENISRLVDIEKIRECNYSLNTREYIDSDVMKKTFEHTIKLGDISQVRRGVQLSKEDIEDLTDNATHYFLNIKDVENGKILYDEETKINWKSRNWLGKFDVLPTDIIITSKGSSIKIGIVDDCKPAFISGNLSLIRVDSKKYNAYLLYQFLQSELGVRLIEVLQTGTLNKTLNPSRLEQLEIPCFDIEYMNEIGESIKESKLEYEKTIEEAELKISNIKRMIKNQVGF